VWFTSKNPIPGNTEKFYVGTMVSRKKGRLPRSKQKKGGIGKEATAKKTMG